MTTVTFLASFIIISLAAYLIGKLFTRLGLPYITGYLFTGALAGPFLLDLLPADAVTRLRFVDQLSLAVIAFVAGSELYLKEIRQRLRSIFFTASGIAVVGLIFGTGAIFALTNFLSFTQGRPFSERMVIAV